MMKKYEQWSRTDGGDVWLVEVVDGRPTGCYGPLGRLASYARFAEFYPYLFGVAFEALLARRDDYEQRPLCTSCRRVIPSDDGAIGPEASPAHQQCSRPPSHEHRSVGAAGYQPQPWEGCAWLIKVSRRLRADSKGQRAAAREVWRREIAATTRSLGARAV